MVDQWWSLLRWIAAEGLHARLFHATGNWQCLPWMLDWLLCWLNYLEVIVMKSAALMTTKDSAQDCYKNTGFSRMTVTVD